MVEADRTAVQESNIEAHRPGTGGKDRIDVADLVDLTWGLTSWTFLMGGRGCSAHSQIALAHSAPAHEPAVGNILGMVIKSNCEYFCRQIPRVSSRDRLCNVGRGLRLPPGTPPTSDPRPRRKALDP